MLNECAEIGKGIDTIDRNLNQMRMLQDRSLNEADSSASGTSRQLDALSSETMAHYRTLVERVRILKSNPESRTPKNQPQVQRIDRRLKEAINAYQQVEAQFRKKNQDQMARQYRIVRPEADENEVRAAVEDPTGGQIFQQALMQSNRRGQAQSVLSAVQDRHAQLQKIEQQLIELAQLFQDMDTLVVQQEELVTNIEQKAEETVENFDKGNEEIGTAINTARSTRKKKWICLAICGKYRPRNTGAVNRTDVVSSCYHCHHCHRCCRIRPHQQEVLHIYEARHQGNTTPRVIGWPGVGQQRFSTAIAHKEG